MKKWSFVFCALSFFTGSEIDDKHVTWSARDIEPVHPRHDHIGVWFAVRIRRAQHLQRLLFADVERAAFRVAHEGDLDVGGKLLRGRGVGAGGTKIRIDSGN